MSVAMEHLQEILCIKSNGRVTDDVTWPWEVEVATWMSRYNSTNCSNMTDTAFHRTYSSYSFDHFTKLKFYNTDKKIDG